MAVTTGFSRSSDPADGLAVLQPHEFRRLQTLVERASGIQLRPGKEALVRGRLARRLRATGSTTFARYLDRVEHQDDGTELTALLDALVTSKTSFFREPAHFDYLRDALLPALADDPHPIRIWCAGCATGEEAFTLAMVLREHLPPELAASARILATDLSTQALAHARRGVYRAEAIAAVPPAMRLRWFGRATLRAGAEVPMHPELRAMVRFARLNLLASWPMRGTFDAIFCRNVMIYFAAGARERVVRRFETRLAPGGHLFVGHSESLGTLPHTLRYIRPAVYAR